MNDKRNHRMKLPAGITLVWLPCNQAMAVCWHHEVLRIFNLNQKEEMNDYLRDLNR